MKKITFSFLLMLLVFTVAFSQVPSVFNYQAVVRNSSGAVLANQGISFKISILQDSESGTVAYSETQTVSTNSFGLVNFEIGNGDDKTGIFSPDGWGASPHFIKIEIDPAGGTAFTHLSTNKMVSVPYAFHAQTVTEVDDADADPKNEIQTLKLTGNLLELSNGGGEVTLPSSGGGGGGDNWGVQVVKTDATLTGNGTSINPLSVVPDGDGDDTNELQTLSRSGDKIELSNGGGSVTDMVDDADADSTNEIQTISLDGTLLKLSNGGGEVTLPSSGGGGGDNWGAQVVNTDGTLTGDGTSANPLSVVPDGDADDSNELQTLSLSGNNLSLSDEGGTVTLPDNSKWVSDDNGIVNFEGYDHVGINMPSDEDISLIVNSRSNGALKVINNSAASYPLYAENGNAGGAAAMFKNKIVIQDGNQTAGKVLTSDNNGVATWQTPAAGGSSLWTESGSDIYRSSGKVGIGSSSLGFIKLDVETSEDWIAIKGVNNSDNYGALFLQNFGEGPAADIRGKVIIKDGTEGAGKVLTSDASGNASWQTPATAGSGLWTESGSDIYRSSGKVGIGTTTPSSPLEIKSDAINALIIGSATEDGANRPGIQFKNNTMQYFSGDDGSDEIFGFLSKWGSSRTYDAKLCVYGKASGSWGKFIEISHTGTDGTIRTDVGDIELSPAGKDVVINDNIKVNGEVHSNKTGTANMIPVAYGTINSSGSILTSSGNISVTLNSTGTYYITINSESFNTSNYITTATIIGQSGFIYTGGTVDNKLMIKVFDTDNVSVNAYFSFIVYKP